MQIVLLTKPGHADTGVGRYAIEMARALSAMGHQVTVVHPIVPLPRVLVRLVRRWLGWDLKAFLDNYPVRARYPQADVYHLASQNLATLMLFCRPPGRTVITVHDLIPWLSRQDPELRLYRHRVEGFFDRLALSGLGRASGLIADSEATRLSLLKTLGPRDMVIETVALGIA